VEREGSQPSSAYTAEREGFRASEAISVVSTRASAERSASLKGSPYNDNVQNGPVRPTLSKIGLRRARLEIAHRVSVLFDDIAQRSDGAVGAAAYGIARRKETVRRRDGLRKSSPSRGECVIVRHRIHKVPPEGLR